MEIIEEMFQEMFQVQNKGIMHKTPPELELEIRSRERIIPTQDKHLCYDIDFYFVSEYRVFLVRD